MVARFPESEPRIVPLNFSCRAYQLAEDPESAATMASAGICPLSSQTSLIGLTKPGLSLSIMASSSVVSHQSATLDSIVSRHFRSSLCSEAAAGR